MRRESLQLVRDHVSCMSEISLLMESKEEKLATLEGLTAQYNKYVDWAQKQRHAQDTHWEHFALKQLKWATDEVIANHRQLPRLYKLLKDSLDVVSHA